MRILWALTEDGAFVRWGTLLAFVLFVVLGISKADDDAEGHVTCGSILKIRDSGTGVTLRSRDAIIYAQGSTQQIVSGVHALDDQDDLWLVKEAHAGIPCEVGKPMKCGDTIRLEHVRTHMNLHTHLDKATFNRDNHEVSCFGSDGDGDAGDSWEIVCKSSAKDGYWNSGKSNAIFLKNVQMQTFLVTSKAFKYTVSNCGHSCPLLDHQEVSTKKSTKKCYSSWYADQGVYLHLNEECFG